MENQTIVSMKQTSFYLHSNENRRLYPSIKYPLTHQLDSQSLHHRLSKQLIYVKHFKLTFVLLLLFTLVSTIFFQAHIYVYNSFFGPFHYNFHGFLEHMKKFENGQSWLKRIEYIQIELGENNIRNSSNKYDIIRKYSDPYTRQKHIATYKKVIKPDIYVKLPTRSQRNFHAHHSFHFPSFSIRTLQCIVKQLQSNSTTSVQNWIEKSEYIKYINDEYEKNSTLFNILVLTKCGILIGYLYRPFYDKAFLPTREHQFSMNDIAFDATRQYCSFYPLILCSFIFSWLFLKALFYLFIYLSNIIRYKFFVKISFISFPLNLSTELIEELWLLNLEGSSARQLLQLDQLIQKSEHKFNDQLFIVKNPCKQFSVVLLKNKLHEEFVDKTDFSPLIICPVSDIRKIVQYGGIGYGEDLSWIPWPSTMTEEENCSEWLHEELMEISEDYKRQYEYRLRNEHQPVSNSNQNHRRRHVRKRETSYEIKLKQFVREEENFQRLKRERERVFERLFEQSTPAAVEFIAKFRMHQPTNQNRIDSTMMDEELKCMICLSEFQLEDTYEKWPCPSTVPHIFHDDCMLNMLRRKNTCPICRHPVEVDQPASDTISQFFTQLVF